MTPHHFADLAASALDRLAADLGALAAVPAAAGEEGESTTLWSAVSPILTREEADALRTEMVS